MTAWTHLLLFDGVCHLCAGSVQFILKHDRKGQVSFASIQSDYGSALYREHGHDPAQPDTMLLITPAGVYAESRAAIEVAWLLGGWWRAAVLLRLVPGPLRDVGYRWFARNRYRWFGKEETCWLPRPEWKARFIG